MNARALVVVLLLVSAGCSGAAPGSVTGTAAERSPAPTETGAGAAPASPTASPTASATPSPSPTPAPDNPWREEPIRVYVDAPDDERNYTAMVVEALAYWEGNAGLYDTAYDPEYRITESLDDAHVNVVFPHNVSNCGYEPDTTILGCAPRAQSISPGGPAVVEVARGYTAESIRSTLIHELGHTLGLVHGEGPNEYMNATFVATALPQQNATERANPWKKSELTVHLEIGPGYDRGEVEEIRSQLNHSLAYFERGADGTLDANYSSTYTDDADAADVHVRVIEQRNICREINDGSCVLGAYGRDVDADERLEYYTSTTIGVEDVDTDAVGWYTSYWLAYYLGLSERHELPDALRTRDRGDRRSEWWN